MDSTSILERCYTIVQVNGQYIARYSSDGPPMYKKRGCEVYIKHIPRDATMEEIFDFVSRCGLIFEIRILMDFSGYNRGYCFVNYFDSLASRLAACALNGEEIREDYKVIVKLSLDNNQLCISNVPSEMKPLEVFHALATSVIGKVGLKSVVNLAEQEDGPTKMFILNYSTHRRAVEARKLAWPKFMLFGRVVYIDWHQPDTYNLCTRVYFVNAPPSQSKFDFFHFLASKVDGKRIYNIQKNGHSGHIVLQNATYANTAVDILNGVMVQGKCFRVSLQEEVLNQIPFGDMRVSLRRDAENSAVPREYLSNVGLPTRDTRSLPALPPMPWFPIGHWNPPNDLSNLHKFKYPRIEYCDQLEYKLKMQFSNFRQDSARNIAE